jgi:hypothetical protein
VSYVPIFRLKLRNGASIGPSTLKRIWSLAAMSNEVVVSRDQVRDGPASRHNAYVVSCLVPIGELTSIESTLRRLLQQHLSAAHIELTRLI